MRSQTGLALGVVWYVAFVVSIVCHEAAHGLAAWRLGDSTARGLGLVTLNPLPHIQREPVGMLAAPVATYVMGGWMIGWASTPISADWAQRNPKQAALVGLSGPAANLLLVVLAGLLIRIGIAAGVFARPGAVEFVRVVNGNGGFWSALATGISILFTLNLLLFVFNLIPVPPLDGTSLVELLLSGRALEVYRVIMSQPGVQAIGIVIAWMLLRFLYAPALTTALRVLYPGR